MKHLFFFVWLLATGCVGIAGETDAGDAGPTDAGAVDAGPPPITYTQFTQRTDGWPAGARLRGAAVLDNVLFAATDRGLLSLGAAATTWVSEPTPLQADLAPTSLQRVDQALVMTAAGASGGGLYVKPFDGPWAKVAAAPGTPTWLLVKKSSEWLLATTGGLFSAPALDGPWVARSAPATPLFTRQTTRLVAAPGQQKLFASGDPAGGFGGLFESADLGVTWAPSSPRGQVEALTASGAFVLLSTSMDGQQRSDNYGNTFKPATAPLGTGVLTYVAQGARFWAGGNAGLARSDDDGVTFVDAALGLPASTPVRALFFAGRYALVDTPGGPYLTQVE